MPYKHSQLRVAIAQPMVVPGDCVENIRRMEHLVRRGSELGADIVLFSECGITGYDLNNVGIESAIPIDHPLLDRIADQAMMSGSVIVNGLYERDGEYVFNTAVAFFPDGKRVVQRKHNIIEAELATGRVTPGPRERRLFEVDGLTCALMICADGGTPGIWEEMATGGVSLVLHGTAGLGKAEWGFRESELSNPARRSDYIKAAERVCYPSGQVVTALRLGMAIAAVNQCGWDEATGYFHPGHSSVVDRDGRLTALIPGRMVCEHVQTEFAIGQVHGPDA